MQIIPLTIIYTGVGILAAAGVFAEFSRWRQRRQRRGSQAIARPHAQPTLEVLGGSLHIKVAEPTVQAPTPPPQLMSDDLILAFHIMPTDGGHFMGYDLLQVLLSTGLQYGEQGIFNCFDQGEVLFSLAQVTKPGTFDINKMGAVVCKGLTLFMHVTEDTVHPQDTYELMLGVARQLAFSLEGELYNQRRDPLSQMDIKTAREQLRAFASLTMLESA